MLKVCKQLDTDLQQPLQTDIIKDATTRTQKIKTTGTDTNKSHSAHFTTKSLNQVCAKTEIIKW